MEQSRTPPIRMYVCVCVCMCVCDIGVQIPHSALQGWDVFNEMVNISSRGVKIRIVQNPPNEEYPDLDSLALEKMGAAEVQNINFTALVGSGILHTKLWVVDQKHFYVGSANMDWRSLTQVGRLPHTQPSLQ